MKRETKQLILLMISLLVLLAVMKFVNDYVQEQNKVEYKSIKKQYFLTKEDKLKEGKGITYLHVEGLTDKQKEGAELALIDYFFDKEKESKESVDAADVKDNKETKDDFAEGVTNKTDIILGKLPEPDKSSKMSNALKEESQRVLSRFTDTNKDKPEQKISLDCNAGKNTNDPSATNQAETTLEAQNQDWRVAKYVNDNITDKVNYTIEEISMKFAFEGGSVNGIYKNMFSSTTDLDVPIKYNKYYLINGVFEGGNGGYIKGEMTQIDQETGHLLQTAEPIPFYGKMCATGNGFIITTNSKGALKPFTLAYPAWPSALKPNQ